MVRNSSVAEFLGSPFLIGGSRDPSSFPRRLDVLGSMSTSISKPHPIPIRPGIIFVLLIAACSEQPQLRDAEGHVEFTPQRVDFGETQLGDSVKKTLLITNRGPSNLSLSHLDGPDEVKVYPAQVSIEGMGEANVIVEWKPSTPLLSANAIRWKSSGGKLIWVGVEGSATDSAVKLPSEMNFGDVEIGASLPTELSIQSTVDHPIEITLEQPKEAEFSWELPAIRLDAREKAIARLVFSPTKRQLSTTHARLLTCPNCRPFEITAFGQGVGRELLATPNPIDFGVVGVGQAASVTIDLYNDGELALDLDFYQVDSPFTLESAEMPDRLEPMGSTEAELRFSPTHEGRYDTSLILLDRLSSFTFSLPIRARAGTSIVSDPSELDFGTVPVGAFVSESVSLEVAGLSPSLQIASAMISSDDLVFATEQLRYGQKTIGEEGLELEVEFHPNQEGKFSGELRIRTIENQGEVIIPLRGAADSHIDDRCNLGIYPPDFQAGLLRTFTLERRKAILVNNGERPCWIRELRWSPSNEDAHYIPSFNLSQLKNQILAPREARYIEITDFQYFQEKSIATAYIYYGRLPVDAIRFESQRVNGAPIASPNQLFFPSTLIGEVQVLSFSIDEPSPFHHLGSIRLSDGGNREFRISSELPEEGSKADGVLVEIAFEPSSAGFHYGQVEVDIYGFVEPLRIDLVGHANEIGH